MGTKYKVELKYFKAKSVLRIHITRSEFDLIKDRRALSHQFNNVIDEFEQNYADKIIGWYEEGEEIFKEMHASYISKYLFNNWKIQLTVPFA